MSYPSSSPAEKEFIMLERNRLVPELMVTDLDISLAFWVSCLGFEVAYQRPEDGFAYLDLNGAQVMLEQTDPHAGQWLTAPLSKPFGRGSTCRSKSSLSRRLFTSFAKRDTRFTANVRTLGIGWTTARLGSESSSCKILMAI